MAVLAIDYGGKRVGLAIAVDGQRPARLKVALNNEGLLDHLRNLVHEHDAATIVVGLPRNLDGDDTAQTRVARRFAELLATETGSEIVLQDEAGTSQVARERLRARGMADQEVERWVDSEAAVIMLEDYLDQR
jgi:putative Holliday junction resolvase